jgi:hypothetical protein
VENYNVSWKRGRRVGAIGIFYPDSVNVAAETPEKALLKAYETHEHLMMVTVQLLGKEKVSDENTNN